MPKIIAISGEIGWDVWPDQIRAQIKEAKNNEPITFEISSPGGYIYDGLEIFNLIKTYPGETTTIAVGMAASMASVLLMAGDKKKAMSNAIFMIHNARSYAGGDQNQLRKVANILEGMSNMLANEYVKASGKLKAEIKSLMDEETFYFGGESILEAGFIDEVIDTGEKLEAEALDDLGLEAMAAVELLDKKLRSEPEKFENLDKIAAILKPKAKTELSTQRTSANYKPPKPEETMNWDEFMNKPENQARLNALMQEKRDEERTSVKAELDSKMNRLGAVMQSEIYANDSRVRDLVAKALKGEITMDGFEVGVTVLDTKKEAENSDNTEEEEAEDTNTGSETPNPEKPANSADMKEMVANMKGKKGGN